MARILFFVFILLLLNAIIVIAGYSQVKEGKYGKEYLYKTKNVKYIKGCHIRNIKYDKGIIVTKILNNVC